MCAALKKRTGCIPVQKSIYTVEEEKRSDISSIVSKYEGAFRVLLPIHEETVKKI
jgi:hypothetical protein